MPAQSPLFTIHYFREFDGFRVIPIDGSMRMETQNACPACEHPLTEYCRLQSGTATPSLRIGCCTRCGYQGYMDRPAASWMTEFYRDEWDGAQGKDAAAEAARRTSNWLSEAQRQAIALINKTGVSRDALICEVGCGYGNVLKEFTALGFTNLIGIEGSSFRAEVASARTGMDVLVGNFESQPIREHIQKRGGAKVFFSFHVLEHIYEPHQALRSAASLQDKGDYLILSLPNGETEGVPTSLFWLPHLHGFTWYGLEQLLMRSGYEIAHMHTDYSNQLMVLARRTDTPTAKLEPPTDVLPRARARVLGLLTPMSGSHVRYLLCWRRKRTDTFLKPAFSKASLDRVALFFEKVYRWLIAHFLRVFREKRSVVISFSPEAERERAAKASPLVVAYEGEVKMLVQ